MLTKISLAYLAGSITTATGVFLIGGRPTFVAFCFGLFVAAVVTVYALSNAKRLRAAALLMNRIATALDGRETKTLTTMSPAEPEGVEREVIDALISMGMKNQKRQAAAIARRAVEQTPGAPFEQTFRAALQIRSAS